MPNHLTDEQRSAILADGARLSRGTEAVVWDGERLTGQRLDEAQVLRALRVVALLDGLSEGQVAVLMNAARVSADTDSRIADAKDDDETKLIAKYRSSSAANNTLARALEVLRGDA